MPYVSFWSQADASARAALKRATEANDLQSQACHRSVVDIDVLCRIRILICNQLEHSTRRLTYHEIS